VLQLCANIQKEISVKIDIIREAHLVMQFYANQIIIEKMPVQLSEYMNFGEASESYFNTKRKEEMPDIQAINPRLRNY
jgi:hypothetical protein